MDGRARRQLARTMAEVHGGVVSRARLRSVGIERRHVAFEVRSERWLVHGNQTVAVHTRPLSRDEDLWRAIWEIGPRIALIDGVTALHVAGLKGYADDEIHVSVVHTARVASVPGVTLHKVIRRVEGETIGTGLPRARPATAAIRAAHWAVSDRQAALILLMAVQQRLVTPRQLADAGRLHRGRRRRGFIRRIVRDIADGVQSLGELDFARLCRARGLPEPDRQVVVETERGRIYLDVRWRCGVAVEIDGAQHRLGLAVTDDNLRRNAVTLRDGTTLGIDVIGLRLETDAFMDQVAEALVQRQSRAGTGWRPPPSR